MMVNVKYIKLPFSTKVYRKGQKVWVIFTTGNASIYVCGRYKGWGRYVESYVSYISKVHSDLMEYAKTGIIPVEESFAKRHFLRVYGVTDELVITEKKGSGEGKSASSPFSLKITDYENSEHFIERVEVTHRPAERLCEGCIFDKNHECILTTAIMELFKCEEPIDDIPIIQNRQYIFIKA